MHAPDVSYTSGTGICLDGQAFLIRGESGAGKSSLALYFLSCGAKLIADDLTPVAIESNTPIALNPQRGAGCVEVRPIGIVSGFPTCDRAPIAAVIELTPEKTERLPEPCETILNGCRVPMYRLWQGSLSVREQAWTVTQIALNKLKIVSTLTEKE